MEPMKIEEFIYRSLEEVIDLQDYTEEEVFECFVGFTDIIGGSKEEEMAKFDKLIEEEFDLPTVIKMTKPMYKRIFSELEVATIDELKEKFEEIGETIKNS